MSKGPKVKEKNIDTIGNEGSKAVPTKRLESVHSEDVSLETGVKLNRLNTFHEELLRNGFEFCPGNGGEHYDVYMRGPEELCTATMDRLEMVIVGDTEDDALYAVIEHNDDDTEKCETWNSPTCKDVAELVQWIEANRRAECPQVQAKVDDRILG